jgi:hypothetical protein
MKAFLFFAALSFLCGCSSSRVLQTSGTTAPVGHISEIKVNLQHGKIKAQDEETYHVNSVSGAIRQALIDELQQCGKLSNSGVTIEMDVTAFRLRSGTEVFWLGVMAGSDYLAGSITVKDGDRIIKTFAASAKGTESAWSGMATGRLTGNSRVDLFCRSIAKKITSQL